MYVYIYFFHVTQVHPAGPGATYSQSGYISDRYPQLRVSHH